MTGLLAIMSEASFLSWGWRIPFLLSALLVLFGLWVRKQVDETPAFRKIKSERKEVKVPIVEIFKTQWPSVLKAIGAKLIETSTFFIFATFSVSYAIGLGYTRSQALNAVLVAAVIAIPCMLAIGAIWSIYGALMGTFLAESFTADVRNTGISLGYQVGAAIAGGPAPLIATALVGKTNNYPMIGIFVGICAVISFVSVMMTRDRSGQVLDD